MTKPRSKRSSPDDHLLVVSNDDNEAFHLACLLQRFEYRVVTARTAAHALASLSAAMPLLVITKQALPDMSAVDLITRLNKRPGANQIPVIVLAGAYDVGAEKRVHNAGAAAYLASPIQPEDLYRAVQSALEVNPRKNVRIRTSLPATIDGSPLDFEKGECVATLSEQGMCVKMHKPRQQKTLHSVLISINDRSIPVLAEELYRQLPVDGSCGERGVGFRFVEISLENRQFIKQHIMAEVLKDIPSGGRDSSREGTGGTQAWFEFIMRTAE